MCRFIAFWQQSLEAAMPLVASAEKGEAISPVFLFVLFVCGLLVFVVFCCVCLYFCFFGRTQTKKYKTKKYKVGMLLPAATAVCEKRNYIYIYIYIYILTNLTQLPMQ